MSKKGKACAYGTPVEAWAIGVPNDVYRTERIRCDYADANPERFIDTPRWVLGAVVGGRLINEHDCERCPAFQFKGRKLRGK